MATFSDILSVASKAFGIIPGLAVLSTHIGIPPNSSPYLFSGVIESLGVFTLLIVTGNKRWISGKTLPQINRLALLSIALFVLLLFAYLFLYNYLVVEVENSQPLLFPLYSAGELTEGLARHSGREGLIAAWGRDDVYKTIQSSSRVPLILTTLFLLLIYATIFTALTFSFGVLAVKTGQDTDKQS